MSNRTSPGPMGSGLAVELEEGRSMENPETSPGRESWQLRSGCWLGNLQLAKAAPNSLCPLLPATGGARRAGRRRALDLGTVAGRPAGHSRGGRGSLGARKRGDQLGERSDLGAGGGVGGRRQPGRAAAQEAERRPPIRARRRGRQRRVPASTPAVTPRPRPAPG